MTPTENPGDTSVAELESAPRRSRNEVSGFNLTEALIFLSLIATWFALQMWILPRFGVST